MKKIIEIFLKWGSQILKWFKNNPSLILSLATVALAIITYGYLCETSRVRKIAEQSFILDNSPKVFLAEVTPIPRLNKSKKRLEITLTLKIKNTGMTEAKEVKIDY